MRGLQRPEYGIDVVRRCLDLAELLGVALRERPSAVVLSAELPWLDRELVGALQDVGVTVLAVESQPSARPLSSIGVAYSLLAPPDAEMVAGLLHRLGEAPPAPPVQLSVAPIAGPPASQIVGLPVAPMVEPPAATMSEPPMTPLEAPVVPRSIGGGRLFAVWGGPGAPGRTSVAIHLALDLRRVGGDPILIDGDGWAPAIVQLLGLPTDPSLTTAVRDANNGWSVALAASLLGGPDGLRVLGGLPRADLWPEVRERPWRTVLDAARTESNVVVVDLAAPIEEDEELSFDRVPFRRNIMSRVALEEASEVLMVVRADPVGLRHGIYAFRMLQETLPAAAERVSVVLNQTPTSTRRLQECSSAVEEWTGRPPIGFLPREEAFMRVLWEGRPLSHVAPRSRWLKELRLMNGIPR